MPLLGRTPLLYEAEPARKDYGAGIGYHFGRPSGPKAKPAHAVMSLSGTTDPVLHVGRQSDVHEPSPRGLGSSSDVVSPSAVRERKRALASGLGSGVTIPLHDKPSSQKNDPRFPSDYHASVHAMPPRQAHSELDKLAKEHQTQAGRLKLTYHDVPGMHHSDESVRKRAWVMHARNLANTLGGKTDRKRPDPKVLVKLLRHRQTGALSTTTSFPFRPHTPVPKGHDVIHTVKSEWMSLRSALLLENLPQPRRDPPVHKDAEIRSRIAQLVQQGAHQAAARLSAQLRARHQMRQSAASLPGLEGSGRLTPASRQAPKPAESLTPQQRAWRRTDQTKEKGAETRMMWSPRPAGHKTQVLTSPPGTTTTTLPAQNPKPLDAPESERSQQAKTRKIQRITSDLLLRSPLLQELVTAGGTFATGLRPGSPLRSHPRDARHIPNPPRKSAVTTANVGHTANTGAWVPDQKKRKIKPTMSRLRILIQKDIRDPITRELEAQPAFFPMIQREQLLGEACSAAHIEASSWYRNGNTLDRPEDDLAYAMEEWRKQCPRYEEPSHAAFCSRCDNSFPTFIGGANVLRGDQSWVRRFPLEPFPEPIKPREGPKVSLDFGRV